MRGLGQLGLKNISVCNVSVEMAGIGRAKYINKMSTYIIITKAVTQLFPTTGLNKCCWLRPKGSSVVMVVANYANYEQVVS